ncbi:hypothetical protein PYR71_25735 [Rhizobium sp. MC63]|uniref:Uncharacterized protein n=1 Tax=Rhizobium mulingense TaxID=3031128 RepID=A0ACC6MWX5_9HYPH|nr:MULTISPECIES: hypothetical protein [unclassified Rhizobium]MDF0699831.1 hypothetical protein [Rhizobium sp. MC63]MEA3517884.1 hypothetical protein [Rhizobium sp. MJ31]
MDETDKKRILERLENMRGEILAKIRPREQRYETETPPEPPYVFLQQRVEKPAKFIEVIGRFLQIPEFIEWLRFVFKAAGVVFAAICFWR